MVYLSRYAVAVLTASIALAGSALGAGDAAFSKNLETAAPNTEVKAQKAAEEAALRKRKKVLLGAGIGSALAVAVVFLGLKVLGTKMIQTKHEEAGQKAVEAIASLTQKLTLATDRAVLYIECKLPENFAATVQALPPDDKAKQIQEAGKHLQATIDSRSEDADYIEVLPICGFEIKLSVQLKFIANSPKAGDSR